MSGENRKLGLIGATSAYLVWGFLPIFWKMFGKAGGWEVVAHRVVWSLLVMLLLLVIFKKFHKFKETFHYFAEQKQYAICLTLAAAFAGVNWWINIYGVNSNQVVELGIGMFLTPLISVFLGVLFYKEKLPPLKKTTGSYVRHSPHSEPVPCTSPAWKNSLDCSRSFFNMGNLRRFKEKN